MTLPVIGIAQINPVVGDIHANKARILEAYQALADHCDLIIAPEMSISGYQCEDLTDRPGFVRDCRIACEAIAAQTADNKAALVLGTPWLREDGQRLNAAIVMQEGKISDIRAKHRLPNNRVYDDKRVFFPGPLPEPVEVNGISLGIMICEDLWADEVAAHLAQRGAQILITLNGSVYEHGIDRTRKGWATRHAMRHNIPVIYANLVGGQDEIVFDGGSFAVSAQGTISDQFPFAEDHIAVLDGSNHPRPEQDEADYRIITLGTRDYVRKNGFDRVLIGLSGGIDSALVTEIACAALGHENVHCVLMPSPFSIDSGQQAAQELVRNLGCQVTHIPIEPLMRAYQDALNLHRGLGHENMQSRIRANILMTLSNETQALVLTTGNKSEMAVGYATLYGDMCGAYNPIKDVYKTRVYALARLRGLIPEAILTRPPSAELRPDQLDRDSLPDYEELDAILSDMIEAELGMRECADKGHDAAVVRDIAGKMARAEYKRRQAPPGPKLTGKAFGRDRRLPITNGYDWA